MKEQFAASGEIYPEFDVVAVWREVLRRHATAYTRSIGSEKLLQMPLFLAELQRGVSRKRLPLRSSCPSPHVSHGSKRTVEAVARTAQSHRIATVCLLRKSRGLFRVDEAGDQRAQL
jgi:hypothetical protein